MPNSTSLLAYPDCKEALERALLSERGVRVSCRDRKSAFGFMARCSSFRKLDRKENAKIYIEPAHTLHGRSIYDVLRLTMENHIVVIRRIDKLDAQVIEDIK